MAYHSSYTGPEIDRTISEVRKRSSAWDNKQAKLLGSPGQIVGFDERGSAVGMDFDGYNMADFLKAKRHNVTLKADAWRDNEQAIYIDGISADEGSQLIQPVPASASFYAYADAEIHVEQSLNQLAFTCKQVPLTDIDLFVVVTELKE